jgi:phenylacetate-coenzyme A ligase PaaK-like adenylate-forming protein
MSHLPAGKLPNDILAQLLPRVSSRDPRVIVGPGVGRDAAVIDNGGRSDDVFVYAGGVTVHPMTFRSPLGRERHVVEYQVRQTARGADVALRTDGPVNIEALQAVLESGLSAAGVREPRASVEITQGAFERQATGKLKRFFPLA